MSDVPYPVRRVAEALLMAVAVTLATFVLLHLVPGDPARTVLGDRATAQQLADLRHQWGLDSSLPAQLRRYVGDVAQGDLGQSYYYHRSAAGLVGDRIAVTLWLVAGASVVAVAVSVPLAVLAAARRDSPVDHLVRAIPLLGLGMPAFWVGILLVELLALRAGLLPVGGWGQGLGGHLRSLVLPSVTASLAIVPVLVRSLRAGMLDVLDADFVAVVRAKGVSSSRVLLAHVVRNSVVPTINLLGINVAYLLGSTVVVERVFGLQGLGDLLLSGITNRDFPVVQAVTLVLALLVVALVMVTDLVTYRLDPRIRAIR